MIEIKSDIRERSTFFYGPTEPPIYSVGSVVNTKLLRQKKFQELLMWY